jgi:hypothetical protein
VSISVCGDGAGARGGGDECAGGAGGGGVGHVQRAGCGNHALGICEDGAGARGGGEGRAEAESGTFHAQNVANTLRAYAKMGRVPEKGLMRALEGRAEVEAGTFNAQAVANTLWAACVFSILRAPAGEIQWVHTVAQRLVSLDKAACFNTAQLCQLCCAAWSRVFVWRRSGTCNL